MATDATMNVTVTRVDAPLYQGEVHSVTVPGVEGELTVLPHHEAFISPLKAGTITVRYKNGEETIDIERGILEVSDNQATVLL